MEKVLEELKRELERHGMPDRTEGAVVIRGVVNEDVVALRSAYGEGYFLTRMVTEILRLSQVGVSHKLLWEKLAFCKLNEGQSPQDWHPTYYHERPKAEEPLTVARVREVVATIRVQAEGNACAAPDHEGAHGTEDELYEQVLKAVANGDPNSAELAREALLTKSIQFNRWCG